MVEELIMSKTLGLADDHDGVKKYIREILSKGETDQEQILHIIENQTMGMLEFLTSFNDSQVPTETLRLMFNDLHPSERATLAFIDDQIGSSWFQKKHPGYVLFKSR